MFKHKIIFIMIKQTTSMQAYTRGKLFQNHAGFFFFSFRPETEFTPLILASKSGLY